MKWIRPRVWKWTEIAQVKWSAVLFGMVAGAYLAAYVKQYAIPLLLLAGLLAIRPLVYFFKDSE
jgi:ABC-type uncharacterized transport system permease subunit